MAGTTGRGVPYVEGPDLVRNHPATSKQLAEWIDANAGSTQAALNLKLSRLTGDYLVENFQSTGQQVTTTNVIVTATDKLIVPTGKVAMVLLSASALIKSPAAGGAPLEVWMEVRHSYAGSTWVGAYLRNAGNSIVNQTGGSWVTWSHTRLVGPWLAGTAEVRLVAKTTGTAWTVDNTWVHAGLIAASGTA